MATASTSVQGTSQIPRIWAPTAPQTEPLSYLERCIQDLKPGVAEMHESNAFLWNVVSKATVVGFTVLAVGAFVTVGCLAPVYLPLVGIASFSLMNPAFQLYQQLSLYSVQTQKHADKLKKIAQEYTDLPDDPGEILRKLRATGIPSCLCPDVEQTNTLKPCFAFYAYWKKEEKNYYQKRDTYIEEASQLLNASGIQAPVTADGPSLRKRVPLLRLGALQAEEEGLICKVNAAFVLAVMTNPTFAGSLDELVEFNKSTFEERALAQRFDDPAADHFIQFTDPDVDPIGLIRTKEAPTWWIGDIIAEVMSRA